VGGKSIEFAMEIFRGKEKCIKLIEEFDRGKTLLKRFNDRFE
jgi:hypothetical protein